MVAQRCLWATYNEESQGPRGVGKERKSRLTAKAGGEKSQAPGPDPGWGLQGGGGPGKSSYFERLFLHSSAPNGPGRHRPRGEEQGVTLRERGGADRAPERCCASREGEFNLQPPALDAILSPRPHRPVSALKLETHRTPWHSPIPNPKPGSLPAETRAQAGLGRRGSAREGGGSHRRPGLPRRWPDASTLTPTRVPGARTPAAVQTVFVY